MGVSVGIARAAANTSLGTQSFSDSTGLGGLTPKAYWIIATRGVTDGTAADGLGMYQGMSDGTTNANAAFEEEHAAATSDSQHTTDLTSPPVLIIYNGLADSVIDGSANHSAFAADTVTIDWTDAPSAGWLITVIMFAGSDLSADVFTAGVGNTVDLANDITAIGFEADDVITMIMAVDSQFGNGFIHNDRAGGVTQRTATILSRSGQVTTANYAVVRTDACCLELVVNGTADWYGEASAFDSSGFTLTTRVAGGNSRTLAGIALRYGASPVVSSKVYTNTTPTGTGEATDTGLGATPQAVLYLMNFCEVAATIEGDADGGVYGVSANLAHAQFSNAIATEDNAADSNTQSLSDNQAVNLPLHTGAAGMAATFVAFTSTGVTLNWSDIEAAGKLWPALAIGSGAAGGATILRQMLAQHGD